MVSRYACRSSARLSTQRRKAQPASTKARMRPHFTAGPIHRGIPTSYQLRNVMAQRNVKILQPR